jgi:hypothetical protein
MTFVSQKNIGWVITGLYALFILGASVTPKLLNMQVAIDSMNQIGWPSQHLLMIGVLELVFTILFLIPRTALLGGILMTGLLGGALASHLRVGSPLFSHTLFSIYLGVFMWMGLYCRSETFRKVFPMIVK